MKKTTYFLLVFIIGLTTCKKYEDGPWLSLTSKEKRVVGEWTTNKNGIDLTWNLKENKDFFENAYNSEGEFFNQKPEIGILTTTRKKY